MSNTIRRTSYKKHNKSGRSHFLADYTSNYLDVYEGVKGEVEAWGGKPSVKLTGKAYQQAFHFFHGDTSRGFGWGNHKISRKISHDTLRMELKKEIYRFLKNEEYEVMERRIRCLSWDRC